MGFYQLRIPAKCVRVEKGRPVVVRGRCHGATSSYEVRYADTGSWLIGWKPAEPASGKVHESCEFVLPDGAVFEELMVPVPTPAALESKEEDVPEVVRPPAPDEVHVTQGAPKKKGFFRRGE